MTRAFKRRIVCNFLQYQESERNCYHNLKPKSAIVADVTFVCNFPQYQGLRRNCYHNLSLRLNKHYLSSMARAFKTSYNQNLRTRFIHILKA